MADTPSARAHWDLASNPRPEHRSGRDDRRNRERASFGRLGREPERTSSAAAASQLPRPTRRVGQDERTPAPRGLGDRGLNHRVGAVLSGLGCNATRHQTNVPKQQGAPAAAIRQRKAALACSLGYASARVGTLREADKGAQGSSPPASAPPSTKGMMQNERHGNPKPTPSAAESARRLR